MNNSIGFLDPQDTGQVYLNGELLDCVVEADAERGYVDQIVKRVSAYGWVHERVRRYGSVRILFNGQEAMAIHQMERQ